MKSKYFKKKIFIIFLIIIVSVLTIILDIRLNDIVDEYAQSKGKTILVDSANRAVIEILSENNATYNSMVNLCRDTNNTVTSLETDIVSLNNLKSLIGKRINEILENEDDYGISIPIGTIIGSKITVGRGPQLKFKMKLSSTVITDFSSNFYSAGINQVLHQITVTVDMHGYAVLPHYQTGFNANTSVIAAQTVIVGITPDAYTNVISASNEVTDKIFDFEAENN